MHIISQVTDKFPSWISGRERMTIEKISWSISMKEWCRTGAAKLRPPNHQSGTYLTELPSQAYMDPALDSSNSIIIKRFWCKFHCLRYFRLPIIHVIVCVVIVLCDPLFYEFSMEIWVVSCCGFLSVLSVIIIYSQTSL